MPEDKPFTYEIGTVTATDADSVSYGDIQYSLEGTLHEHFDIYTRRQGTVCIIKSFSSFTSLK